MCGGASIGNDDDEGRDSAQFSLLRVDYNRKVLLISDGDFYHREEELAKMNYFHCTKSVMYYYESLLMMAILVWQLKVCILVCIL